MFVLAVTGGIGSGKSEAARFFAERGAVVLDLDVIAKSMLNMPLVRDRVVGAFGDEVLAEDGSVDTASLAALAFASDEATLTLDRITHPAVLREVGEGLRNLQLMEQPPRLVVLDVPLLVEAPTLAELADHVLAIEAPVEERVRRCVERGMAEADCRDRIARQATDAQRAELAETVIVNDGDLARLREDLEGFWEREVAPHAA
ncbi:MAG TPA: dephospho-CoA kinase [Coriobacteriia bacterium]|jgi:dephospho-CoA kinase